MSLALNLYMLDYPGREREESLLAVGVWLLFIVLLSVSAFTGHSGAYREQLSLVVTSLSLLTLAILHWIILGVVSMRKSNPAAMWNVCIQNRCAETFWTFDFGYRNATLDQEKNLSLTQRGVIGRHSSETGSDVKKRSEHKQETSADQEGGQETPDDWNMEEQEHVDQLITGDEHSIEYDERDDEDTDNFGEEERDKSSPSRKPMFWKRFTQLDLKKKDPSSTLSMVITLVFFTLDIASLLGSEAGCLDGCCGVQYLRVFEVSR